MCDGPPRWMAPALVAAALAVPPAFPAADRPVVRPVDLPAAQAVGVTIDGAKRFQTFDGFGTCLIAWVGRFRDLYRTEDFQRIYAEGVGCTLLRVNMWGLTLKEVVEDWREIRHEDLDFDADGGRPRSIVTFSGKIAGQAEPPEYIRVETRGRLSHGLVAIGGETTGTTVTARGITLELDLRDRDALRERARKLDGESVVVRGSLRMRKGIEEPDRWIIDVETLEAASTEAGAELTKELVKRLVPQASGIPIETLDRIARSPRAPTPDDFESKSLSALLLSLPQGGSKEETEEFGYPSGIPRPPDLFAEILRMRRLGPLALRPGYGTLIHEDRIRDVAVEVDGEEARGTVSFEAPGLYRGKVAYVARRKGGAWRIEEFALPVRGLRTVLGADGTWKLQRKDAAEEAEEAEEAERKER